MAALMLFCGLRSREVIGLKDADLLLTDGQIRVLGKGNKERIVPLAPEVASLITTYLAVEAIVN